METILFIEDDKALRENFGRILKFNNYYPLLAETGMMGLEIIKKTHPDLIICDIMLPDIDGYEILKKLSQDNETKSIPFIYLTANVEMEDLRKDLAALREDVGALVGSLSSSVSERSQAQAERVRAKVADASESVQEGFRSAQDSLNEQVRERPLTGLMLAFGVGMLVGRSLR